MSQQIENLNQQAWDALFDRMIAQTDEVIARRTIFVVGGTNSTTVPLSEPSLDDGLTEQDFSDYEASIRTSPHPPACSCSRCSDARRYDANLEWQDEE